MTKIIANTEFLEKLSDFQELLEVCDASGRTLGYFHPLVMPVSSQNPSIRSPFTDEELDRRRNEPGGFTLAEILRSLGEK